MGDVGASFSWLFRNLEAEEFRGTLGGLTFPFVHSWTYRGGLCEKLEKPFMAAQPARVFEHGTSREGALKSLIREPGENGYLKIDPVAGCQSLDPAAIVYDRANVREIGFPNLWVSYRHTLAEAVRRAGAHVELRGIDRWMGHGDCSANLMWAVGSDVR